MVLTIFSTVFLSPFEWPFRSCLVHTEKFISSYLAPFVTQFFFVFFFADTKIWTMRWSHVAKYCMLPFTRYNRSINHWIKWVMIIALKAFPCLFSVRGAPNRINNGDFFFVCGFLSTLSFFCVCFLSFRSFSLGWVRLNHWAKRLKHWWVYTKRLYIKLFKMEEF